MQVACLGVAIASGLTLAAVDELYPDDLDSSSEAADHRDKFNYVAISVLIVGVVGMAIAAVSAIVRGLYHFEIIKYHSDFLVLAIKVCSYRYVISIVYICTSINNLISMVKSIQFHSDPCMHGPELLLKVHAC